MPRAFCACAFGFAGLALLPLTSSAQQAPSNVLIATLTPVTHPALPNAPSALLFSPTETSAPDTSDIDDPSSSSDQTASGNQNLKDPNQRTQDNSPDTKKKPVPPVELDANGNPIPLNRRQPQRILGFMPNFRSVSGGAVAHPPGWKYNFEVATHQSFDYSSFIFLGITSLSAEGLNSHPVLGKGVDGFYAYTWRGLLDKTDGTYLSAWFLPSLLHEDTRYYAMGRGHSIPIRALYVISRQAVAQTYGGKQTPNIAGLGGKVLTQVISREYYPAGATSFGVLATKFAYASMRDIAFTSIREFYPDIAAHYVRMHNEKVARQAARDAQAAGVHGNP